MTTTTSQSNQVDLDIVGMTCASCVSRVEGRLNALDGVQATVNLATEKARVTFADPHTVDDLLAAVAKTGYTATEVDQHHFGGATQHDHMNHDLIGDKALLLRAIVATVLAAIVLLLAMVPPIREATGSANKQNPHFI